VNSASPAGRCLFPALHLGYLVVPDAWRDAVLKLRRQTERYPPGKQDQPNTGLPQIVLAAFFAQGHFAKHLRRMRELYGARLTALRHDMERYLSGVLQLPAIEAGLNTPAYLLNGMIGEGRRTSPQPQSGSVAAEPILDKSQ
jgi:GntR family transcriptional regulator/MocR family aminotransferase